MLVKNTNKNENDLTLRPKFVPKKKLSLKIKKKSGKNTHSVENFSIAFLHKFPQFSLPDST